MPTSVGNFTTQCPTKVGTLTLAFLLIYATVFGHHLVASPHTFGWQGEQFLLDGKPFVIRSGEMHYPRIPRAYWRDRMRKARSMGLNTICTYIFWNLHEPQQVTEEKNCSQTRRTPPTKKIQRIVEKVGRTTVLQFQSSRS